MHVLEFIRIQLELILSCNQEKESFKNTKHMHFSLVLFLFRDSRHTLTALLPQPSKGVQGSFVSRNFRSSSTQLVVMTPVTLRYLRARKDEAAQDYFSVTHSSGSLPTLGGAFVVCIEMKREGRLVWLLSQVRRIVLERS